MRDRALKHGASVVAGAVLIAVLTAGCSSNQTASKPAVSSADVSACHNFGNEVIAHGPTTDKQERLQLMSQMELVQNADLRKEARAMKSAIEAGNGNAELSAAQNIARICYELGLVSPTGQPK